MDGLPFSEFCVSCITSFTDCCLSGASCADDAVCAPLMLCASNCTDRDCTDACALAHPLAIERGGAFLLRCIDFMCAQACGFPSL